MSTQVSVTRGLAGFTDFGLCLRSPLWPQGAALELLLCTLGGLCGDTVALGAHLCLRGLAPPGSGLQRPKGWGVFREPRGSCCESLTTMPCPCLEPLIVFVCVRVSCHVTSSEGPGEEQTVALKCWSWPSGSQD